MAVNKKKGARGPEWGRVTAAMPLGGMGVHKSDNRPRHQCPRACSKDQRGTGLLKSRRRDDTTRLKED